ncbi:MAG: hypothetical protein AB1666_03725 [Pseudomonadota bacterium]
MSRARPPSCTDCARHLLAGALTVGVAGLAHAQAPAPLVTESPVQIAPGGCQIEGWYEHSRGARAAVRAPACSATQPGSLEGQNLAAIAPRTDAGAGRAALPRGIAAPPPDTWGIGASAKWSAPDWTFGPVRWGLKISSFATHMTQLGWQPRVTSLLGLASIALPADLQLRVNAGPRLDATTGETGALVNAALQWRWGERLQLAGEMRAAEGARTVQTVGSELWLVPGRLGVGLSAGRTVGENGWQNYMLRLNWHLLERKRLGPR